MQSIDRPQYLECLTSLRDNGRAKVITGIRRCGKSFLLMRLYRQRLLDDGIGEEQIVEISLDEAHHARQRNPLELDAYVRGRVSDRSRRHYVLIDEIQLSSVERNPYTSDPNDVVTFADAVLGLLRLPNVDLYVVDSTTELGAKGLMSQLGDHADEVRLRPLGFAEYLPACGDGAHALRDYLTFGGMPRVLAEQGIDAKARYLESLLTGVYLRDVLARNSVRGGRETIEALLGLVAASAGSPTNAYRLATQLKDDHRIAVGHTTVDTYLGYLADELVIDRVGRLDVKRGKRLKTPSKYFFADVGLRNALLGRGPLDEDAAVQSVVYGELVRRGLDVSVGVVPFSTWVEEEAPERRKKDKKGKRDKKGKPAERARRKVTGQLEVDFVASSPGQRLYVQVARDGDAARGYERVGEPLRRISDSFRKVVVVRGDVVPWHDAQGVLFVGLEQFLLDERAIGW